MKVIYDTDIPKSRQKKYSPSGTCFSFSWDNIANIIQDFRVKHKYADSKEIVSKVYVDDNGIVFYIEDE